jgi:crotonobetaine/carnitine-CoA ligase
VGSAVFLPNRPEIVGGAVDVLLAAERRIPTGDLLRWEGGRWTVAQFADRARRWARVVEDLGVARGDRVAVVAANGADFLALQYGIYMLRAVEVPINVERRGAMLGDVLVDADPRLILVDPEYAGAVREQMPETARLVTIDDELRLQVARAAPREPTPGPLSELAIILHTSGTTGRSKGVMIPHGYLPQHGASWVSMLELARGDVAYLPLPFFHVDAHCILSACLLSDSTLGFAKRFSVSRFWEDSAALGATWGLAVGSMLSALAARRPAARPNHSYRVIAGAPITGDAFAYFEDELGIVLLQVYGQTEAEAVVGCTLDRNRRGAAGWACTGFDVEVVDEDDKPLPAGSVGRLVYRPNRPHALTLGYWRRAEATAEAMRNLWWHTGDLARIDEDGFMHFAGRVSDSLRRRGENISAWELESVVNEAPGIRWSAAVAVSDEIGGEDEIKLFVILEAGEEFDAAAFFEYCDRALPRYAAPRYVEPIGDDEVSISAGNGSIQKHLLPKVNGERTIDRREVTG